MGNAFEDPAAISQVFDAGFFSNFKLVFVVGLKLCFWGIGSKYLILLSLDACEAAPFVTQGDIACLEGDLDDLDDISVDFGSCAMKDSFIDRERSNLGISFSKEYNFELGEVSRHEIFSLGIMEVRNCLSDLSVEL